MRAAQILNRSFLQKINNHIFHYINITHTLIAAYTTWYLQCNSTAVIVFFKFCDSAHVIAVKCVWVIMRNHAVLSSWSSVCASVFVDRLFPNTSIREGSACCVCLCTMQQLRAVRLPAVSGGLLKGFHLGHQISAVAIGRRASTSKTSRQ